MKIGDRIRSLRLVKKMTQGQLIEGIASITYLSKVENNQTQPTDNFIKKIAERLNIAPSLLLEQMPDEFTKKLENIYDHYWKHDILSEENLALLQVQVNETHVNRSFLMIFTTLIRYYFVGFRLYDAKLIFEQSTNLINAYDSSVEERLYFNYYLICGKLLMDLHMPSQANEYLLRCESYIAGADDQDRAKLYFSLSIVNQQLNEDKLACLYYSGKSYEYQKKLGDSSRLAMVLFTRAIQFHLVSQPKDAMNSLKEAKACYWDQDNPNLRAILEYSIGRVYQVGKDYDQAITSYMNAIQLFLKSSFKEKSVQVHKRLIEIYIEQKEWRLVEKHLGQAQTIAMKRKNLYYDVELDILQASIYKHQAQEANYEKAMRRIIEHCMELEYYYHIKNLATEFGAYFYNKKSYKKAATYYHQAFHAEQIQKSQYKLN